MLKLPLPFIAILLLSYLQTDAQYFRKFKAGLNMGYQTKGFLINLQPSYKLNDIVQIGLRLEGTPAVGNNDTKSGSLSVNAQYYLQNSTSSVNRPYIGLGLGKYDGAVGKPSYFGVYPRIGMDAKHFNFNLDYNIVSQYSFIGVSLGFFVGGGRK